MLDQKDLIKKVKGYNKFLNPQALSKAYAFALNAHKDQKRDSGDPYLTHPVAVANILTDLKLDSSTITTGLLHDTIEDTKATYKMVKEEFGKEVADLVDGVTKISELEDMASSSSKAENFRKLILATSKDIRVLLVKLADRLHNMRTLNYVPSSEKRLRKAKETMEIYSPLADRMGMNRIRDELEDLSFAHLNPEARKLIVDKLSLSKKNSLPGFGNQTISAFINFELAPGSKKNSFSPKNAPDFNHFRSRINHRSSSIFNSGNRNGCFCSQFGSLLRSRFSSNG